MTSVVYDAGVLIAADRDTRSVWAEHRVRLEAGIVPVVPAPSSFRSADRRRRSSSAGCSAVVTS
jgi:hypothetical protein